MAQRDGHVHGGYERLHPKPSHLDIHFYLTIPTGIAEAHAYLCACPFPNAQITQSFWATNHQAPDELHQGTGADQSSTPDLSLRD